MAQSKDLYHCEQEIPLRTLEDENDHVWNWTISEETEILSLCPPKCVHVRDRSSSFAILEEDQITYGLNDRNQRLWTTELYAHQRMQRKSAG